MRPMLAVLLLALCADREETTMDQDALAKGRAALPGIRERCAAATPGPWKWWISCSWRRLKRDDVGVTQNVLEPHVARDLHPDLTVSQEDMDFIAASRTDLPLLCDALEAAQAEIERLTAAATMEHAQATTAIEELGDCSEYRGKLAESLNKALAELQAARDRIAALELGQETLGNEPPICGGCGRHQPDCQCDWNALKEFA